MPCDCCCTCVCASTFTSVFASSPGFEITFSDSSTQEICLQDMDSGPDNAPQYLRCGAGTDQSHPAATAGCYYWIVWYDGTCHWRIYFSLSNFPSCNCVDGSNCTLSVQGWENYDFPDGCDYSISGIEITGPC